jgi:hypothetical protein
VSDAGLVHLRGLSRLERLDLRRTAVTKAGLAHLKRLTGLRNLEWDDQLFQPTPGQAALAGRLIEQLGSRHFFERQKASRQLAEMGRVALPALQEAAADSSDPEVRRQAALLVQAMERKPMAVAQDQAVAAIRRMRGKVVVDENRKGRPVVAVSLRGTNVDDVGLGLVAGFSQLEELDLLCQQRITDTGLVHLRGLTRLKKLILTSSHITDRGLEHLKGLKNLQTLHLYSSKVTAKGIFNLQKALPKVRITPRRY